MLCKYKTLNEILINITTALRKYKLFLIITVFKGRVFVKISRIIIVTKIKCYCLLINRHLRKNTFM